MRLKLRANHPTTHYSTTIHVSPDDPERDMDVEMGEEDHQADDEQGPGQRRQLQGQHHRHHHRRPRSSSTRHRRNPRRASTERDVDYRGGGRGHSAGRRGRGADNRSVDEEFVECKKAMMGFLDSRPAVQSKKLVYGNEEAQKKFRGIKDFLSNPGR